MFNEMQITLLAHLKRSVHVRICHMMQDYAYFDHSATTPVDERVLEAMLPYFNERFGNPSSVHKQGQAADAGLSSARILIADLLGCSPGQITFTSGASESNNLALVATALARRESTGAQVLISTALEHPSVLNTLQWLKDAHGFRIEYAPVDSFGKVIVEGLERLITNDVAMVSVIYANNEIGTLNPIGQISELCRAHGIPLHADATQAPAYLPVDRQFLPVDMLTLGAHKFYGPKGVGVLVHPDPSLISPLLHGGSQEGGLRPGTENVALIVGMAKALELSTQLRAESSRKAASQRDRIIQAVLEGIEGVKLTGHPLDRLPHHASFAFENLESNALLAALDLEGFACSAGSACKVGNPRPSAILLALGFERSWALGSLRVSLGRSTRDDDIDRFRDVLPAVVGRLRAANLMERS